MNEYFEESQLFLPHKIITCLDGKGYLLSQDLWRSQQVTTPSNKHKSILIFYRHIFFHVLYVLLASITTEVFKMCTATGATK